MAASSVSSLLPDVYSEEGLERGLHVPYDVDPKVWGKPMWDIIHIYSWAYAEQPTKEVQQAAYQFLDALRFIMCCGDCRGDFRDQVWTLYPLKNYLHSRATFIEWSILAHSHVDEKLGKPPFDYAAYMNKLIGSEVVEKGEKEEKKEEKEEKQGEKQEQKAEKEEQNEIQNVQPYDQMMPIEATSTVKNGEKAKEKKEISHHFRRRSSNRAKKEEQKVVLPLLSTVVANNKKNGRRRFGEQKNTSTGNIGKNINASAAGKNTSAGKSTSTSTSTSTWQHDYRMRMIGQETTTKQQLIQQMQVQKQVMMRASQATSAFGSSLYLRNQQLIVKPPRECPTCQKVLTPSSFT